MTDPSTTVAFVGDADSTHGFSALGLRLATVQVPEQAAERLDSLVAEGYKTIFITEEFALPNHDRVVELMMKHPVSILMVPGREGSTGRGLEMVKRMAVKALGADILKVDE